MRKEKLEALKKGFVTRMPGYVDYYMMFASDDYRKFSVSQLELLRDTLTKAEKMREKKETWHSLSVNEVVNRNTGKIICVDNDGKIFEKSEEDIARGAACKAYANWKKRMSEE